MKKSIITILIFTLSLTTAFAQEETIIQKQEGKKMTITITKDGLSHTDSIGYISYTLSKLRPDSIKGTPMYASMNIGIQEIPHFLLKAASGDFKNGIIATIKYYSKSGKVIHTLQLKDAHIFYLSGNLGTAQSGVYNSATFEIKAPHMKIDGATL